MIRLRPISNAVRKLGGRPVSDLQRTAQEQWDVAPGSTLHVQKSIFLPGQLDRIVATEFAPIDHVRRVLKGGFDLQEGPTRAYRVADVDLVDGVLYGPNSQRPLRPRITRSPLYWVPSEIVSGALYETWNGNRWFGCWLAEDVLAYPLAAAAGTPVTTTVGDAWAHRQSYEALLGLSPRRLATAHFDELILFDDTSNNTGRAKRAHEMRSSLIRDLEADPVPGVFLLRGASGDLRLLANESEIADRLATEYGFIILDPLASTVDEIRSACGQARVVAGVEGSHLVHGAVMMPSNATLFVVQPQNRATVFLKALTDLRGQAFAFVVAQGALNSFTADWDEIRQTLDLALAG
jgi:hypothetical protein